MSNKMIGSGRRVFLKMKRGRLLKVHCWGGLGSQLFAVALYFELKSQFPKREIVLVLHQGGVTRRISEVHGLFSELKTEEIQDYVTGHVSDTKETIATRNRLKRIIKKVLHSCNLVLTLDASRELKSVKPWTVSIRGHYSYRFLSKNSIEMLRTHLTFDGYSRFMTESGSGIDVGVHYRLGDLVDLASKSPLDVQRLVNVCTAINISNNRKISVFSDSPELALELIQGRMPGASVSAIDLPTWETIGSLSGSELFIGTFSKISLWVVIFRYHSENTLISYLPIEAKANLQLLLGVDLDSNRIIFFK